LNEEVARASPVGEPDELLVVVELLVRHLRADPSEQLIHQADRLDARPSFPVGAVDRGLRCGLLHLVDPKLRLVEHVHEVEDDVLTDIALQHPARNVPVHPTWSIPPSCTPSIPDPCSAHGCRTMIDTRDDDPATLPPNDDPADKPHDAFVKRVFTQPEAAAVELRAALPAAVAERLDWSMLRVVPINFVDPSLDRRESDILYAIDIIDIAATRRRIAFLYVLLEHLSTPQRMAAWHFLRYITHIWERYERDQNKPIDSLPLVIPLLLFQGPDGWTEPRRLSELLDVPPELAAAFPSPVELVFDVDDLHQTIEHDQLARDVIVAFVEAARTLLFLARRPDLLDPSTSLDPTTARRIAALGPQIDIVYQELGAEAVHTLLRYVDAAFRKKPTLRAILRRVISEEKRRMYISVYDEMRAEAKAEARAEVKAEVRDEVKAEVRDEVKAEVRDEGKLLGKIEFLVELLSKRGLMLDDELRARLDGCTDEAQLQRWFDRALTVTTVAAVFDATER
jgi:hypothetical protein